MTGCRSENAPLPPYRPTRWQRIIDACPYWVRHAEVNTHWWMHYDHRPWWWFWQGR